MLGGLGGNKEFEEAAIEGWSESSKWGEVLVAGKFRRNNAIKLVPCDFQSFNFRPRPKIAGENRRPAACERAGSNAAKRRRSRGAGSTLPPSALSEPAMGDGAGQAFSGSSASIRSGSTASLPTSTHSESAVGDCARQASSGSSASIQSCSTASLPPSARCSSDCKKKRQLKNSIRSKQNARKGPSNFVQVTQDSHCHRGCYNMRLRAQVSTRGLPKHSWNQPANNQCSNNRS